MTPDEVKSLIQRSEGTKLDFKRQYILATTPPPGTAVQKWRDYIDFQWNELIKDILSLTNGNVGTSMQPGYLIIGVDDVLQSDRTRHLHDTSSLTLTAQQLLNKINSVCSPPIPDLHFHQVMVDGICISVVEIPPSPHLHETRQRLKLAKAQFDDTGALRALNPVDGYSEYTVFIRRGEMIGVATSDERRLLEKEKESINIRLAANKTPTFATQMKRREAEGPFLILDIGLVIGTPIEEIEEVFGEAAVQQLRGLKGSEDLPHVGETREYHWRGYTFAINFDKSGHATGVLCTGGLEKEKYNIEQWPIILSRFGQSIHEQPDVVVPAARKWTKLRHYSAEVYLNGLRGVVYIVRIYKKPQG